MAKQRQSMVWREPRPVEGWYWMDIEQYGINQEGVDGSLLRVGRVSWNRDGTGHYDTWINLEDEGYGFLCWPSFRVLTDAQDFVDRLMLMSKAEIQRLHGTQWPNVVL